MYSKIAVHAEKYNQPVSGSKRKLSFLFRLWKTFQKKVLMKKFKIQYTNDEYCAYVNSKCVGKVTTGKKNEFKKTITITSAYIDEFWQRCGIMTAIYECAKKRVENEGYKMVFRNRQSFVSPAGRAFLESMNNKEHNI